MMVHGRTETKSPKNVKNVYEPTSITEHVLWGDWLHFLHAATETATILIGMIAQMRQWVVAALPYRPTLSNHYWFGAP
jgi:hypothetical protein